LGQNLVKDFTYISIFCDLNYSSVSGVFLVPYFLILIICGIPLLYMELAVGQFTRRGPIGALAQICPLFKGISINAIPAGDSIFETSRITLLSNCVGLEVRSH
jgi:hypothetical protein